MRSVWPALFLFALSLQGAAVRPGHLRCEYRVNPLGIDVTDPRLSWVLEAVNPAQRGLRQSAYHLLVASSEEALAANRGDLWDTGRVSSDQSIQVSYRGKPLASGVRAWWKVQVWDQDGNASEWSAPAYWSMGLLRQEDWKAKWIGRDEEGVPRSPASPYHNLKNVHWIWLPGGVRAGYFRATFTLPAGKRVSRAISITGVDNSYDLYLNGTRIWHGNGNVGMPEVFDIAPYLRSGENTVAVKATAPNGKRPGGLIAFVKVEMPGVQPVVLASGSQWKTIANAPQGWERPGFADSEWSAAQDLGIYGMAPWGEVGFGEERVLPARMLRKEFTAAKPVKRATVFLSGLGLSELYVNGKRIGDDVLSPALMDYDKRVPYVTRDVTAQLAAGKNAIGLMLGNGRYWAPRNRIPTMMRNFGFPKARLQMELEYADGSRSTVVSDETWKLTTSGPIRANNEYDGEEYDARMEIKGWSRPGFNDSAWQPAALVAAPAGVLSAQMDEPLRVTETIKPIKVSHRPSGAYQFDMGQNMVGWCRLKVSGRKGTRIVIRHAETLNPAGNLYVDNLRSARVTDIYTLKGEGAEVWEPRFTYHGFRYVEITGLPSPPEAETLVGRVVHDDMARTADFQTSSELLNQLHHNIFWGVRGNYRSIPTDCPQRDERQGWLGDRSQVSRSESYLFDVAAFYDKWVQDLSDSQKPSGSISDVVPAYWPFYNDNTTWPSTFLFVPGMLYDQYADRRVIEREYPAMKKWMDYMKRYVKDGLMMRDVYGDWCVPPENPVLIHSEDPARKTDGVLIGTAYWRELSLLMARYARLTDRPQDAAAFEAQAEAMKVAFHRKFFNPQSGTYGNATQTSSILALAFDMTPKENRGPLFDALIHKIDVESKGHVGVGLVGAQWLMRTLSENGRPDVAYEIATQTTYPGWGYMISKGATTIWELWNGDTADPAMNSGNHVMQIGDLGVWFYEYLAGIRSDPEHPGFQHILIRPFPAGDLSFVKASHQSMYGNIATHWQRGADGFRLDVTVPPNTTATVWVPARDAAQVREAGKPASQASGVKFVRAEKDAAVYEVVSGSYSFLAPR